jgi:tetratricopeptide (TPR) repeat protein
MLRELSESRRIRTALGDRAGLAVVEKQLGNLYLRRKDLAAARRAFTAAVDLLADQPLAKHRLEAAINLAVCDLTEGKLDAAEQALRQSLACCRAAGYDAGMPRAQLNLALVLERQGRLAEARDLASLAAQDAEGRDFAVARTAALVVARLGEPPGKPAGENP